MSRFILVVVAITFIVVAFDVLAWISDLRNPTVSTLSYLPKPHTNILIGEAPRAPAQGVDTEAEIRALHNELANVQSKTTSLDDDLAQAREQLAQADRDKAAQAAAAKDKVAELQEKQQQAVAAALDEAKRNFTAQVETLQAQSARDRVRATSLDDDLAQAREQLTQADRDKAAQAAAAKDKVEELQGRQQQAVAAALDAGKRNAAAQIEALQAQLASERVRATSLDDDLVGAREQLAQAEREKAAQAAAAKDKVAELQGRQQQIVVAALDEAKRNTAAQVEALVAQLASEQQKVASFDGDLAQAHEQLAQADRDKADLALAKGKETELQARQQALVGALDEAKRSAGAQIQALQSELANAQSKTTSLDDALAQAREQLAVADRDKAAQVAALNDKVTDSQEKQQQAVAAALDEAKRTKAQVEALQAQLASDRVKATSLDDDLARAREQLAQADRDKTALVLAKDTEAELQARQHALAEALDEAKRSATAQIQALQSELANAQSKTTSLDDNLAQAREQLAQADRDKAALAVAKDSEAEPQAKQQALAGALDEAKRSATAQIQALQSELANAKSNTTSLNDALAQAREQLAQADRDKAAQAAAANDKVTELGRQQKTVVAALDEAKRNTKAQVEALQAQLASDRVKATSLGDDLARAREQLAQADRDKAALALAKDTQAELQAKQQVLAGALDEAKRSARAQMQVVQSQLAIEQSKTTRLDDDLARARERLAQADRDKAALAAARNKEAEPQAKQQALDGELDKAKRSATAQIQALQSQLTNEQSKATSLDDNLARARKQLMQADRDKAVQDAALALAAVPVQITPPQNTQIKDPKHVPARVVLRYTRGSNAARERAVTVQLMLQAQGLDVTDPVTTPTPIGTSAVMYFYAGDQSSAKAIADALATPEPFRSRPTKFTPLPRPGTIEVSIAG